MRILCNIGNSIEHFLLNIADCGSGCLRAAVVGAVDSMAVAAPVAPPPFVAVAAVAAAPPQLGVADDDDALAMVERSGP